jgi:hypothetical protein
MLHLLSTLSEAKTMTLLDLSSIELLNPESEMEPETQQEYPDEVLESEWNPVLEELHTLVTNTPESPKPLPLVDEVPIQRPR